MVLFVCNSFFVSCILLIYLCNSFFRILMHFDFLSSILKQKLNDQYFFLNNLKNLTVYIISFYFSLIV